MFREQSFYIVENAINRKIPIENAASLECASSSCAFAVVKKWQQGCRTPNVAHIFGSFMNSGGDVFYSFEE